LNTPAFNQAPHLCATCENLFDCSWRDCVKPDYAKFVSEPFDKVGATNRYRFTIDERCYECEKYKKDLDLQKGRRASSTYNKPVIATKNCVDTEFKSIRYAAEKLNIKHRCISRCLNGYSKTAGGYQWRYAESEVIN